MNRLNMKNSLLSKFPGVRDREGELVYVYFVFIISLMIFYMLILSMSYEEYNDIIDNEKLNSNVSSDIPGLGSISGWKISHLVTFYIAGFLFPHYLALIFILGVTWEIIEYVIGRLSKIIIPDIYEQRPTERVDVDYQHDWISGDIADIIYNTIGMFLGVLTRIAYDDLKSKTLGSIDLSLLRSYH